MKERIKVFTHVSGEGSTVTDTDIEESINEWLAETNGKLIRITQTESQRHTNGQHLTVCVWYIPAE